jgi:hypothetical protein
MEDRMIYSKRLLQFLIAILTVLAGCKKNTEVILPFSDKILTSLICTDTLGQIENVFYTGRPFYLTFTMTNKTGHNQQYYWTGPISEIRILRNDTIIISQHQNTSWPQVVLHRTLPANSTLTNRWLAPVIDVDSLVTLPEGNYQADVVVNARFSNVDIEYPQRISFSIIDTPQVVVFKPNIYLYQTVTADITVKLEFPLGGSVIQSTPTYSDGWNVTVEPTGKIDGQYDYLFYESRNADAFQYSAGWVVSRDTLASFFTHHLLSAGFSEREKDDFIEYWIPRLTDYPYYIIYPQFKSDIDKTIRLNLSKSPDTILRLFYAVKGTDVNAATLKTPTTPLFQRHGFVVTEWGVILK